MASEELISVTPPGASVRRAVRFRGNLPAASIALIASLAIAAFTLAMLWKFDQSLRVDTTRTVIARVIEIALALATLVVPYYGLRTFAASLRAEHLAAGGDYPRARVLVEDSRDHIWVVVGIGLTALVGAFVAYLLSANQGAVRSVLFDWSLIWRSRTGLLKGFWINIKLFVVSEVLVLVWALFVAVVRLLPGPGVRTDSVPRDRVHRRVPRRARRDHDLPHRARLRACRRPRLRQHEQGRPGVLAVDPRARARVRRLRRRGVPRRAREHPLEPEPRRPDRSGLSQWQTMRHVVIPQAVRRIIPPLLNDFVALQKDTALVSFVGVVEILNYAGLYKNRFFNLSPVTGAAIAYLIITIPVTRFVDYLIRIDKATHAGEMTAFVELRDVHKSFGDNEVLRGVDLKRR